MRREPPLLECVRPPGRAVKTPVAACAARHESPGLPAHVQGQPFSGNARHEHPATPSLLAWRSTSTPVPASVARAPAGNFPARGDHPCLQHARRERPLPDTRRCPNPAFWARGARPLFCTSGAPGVGCPSAHTKSSSVESRVPSTAKKGVRTRGLPGLRWAWSGSPPRAVCSQPRTEWSTLRQQALNWARRGPKPAILVPGKD